MELTNILKVVGSSIAVAGLVNTILYKFLFLPKFNKTMKEFESELKQKDLINQERWKHKKDACFNALNIADALLSNYTYPNVKEEDMKQQKITTEKVRKCFNDLACSCDDTKVIDLLKKIVIGNVSHDIIVDLRNAVRLELNFGNKTFDTDWTNAFVAKIASEQSQKK